MWGLSFKPEIDDVREAPALVMIRELVERGATVRAYYPKDSREAEDELGELESVTYCESYYDALEGCDALVVATEWSFFLNPDFARMAKALNTSVIFDGRNIYSPENMTTHGFDYFSVGRQPVLAFSEENPNG